MIQEGVGTKSWKRDWRTEGKLEKEARERTGQVGQERVERKKEEGEVGKKGKVDLEGMEEKSKRGKVGEEKAAVKRVEVRKEGRRERESKGRR